MFDETLEIHKKRYSEAIRHAHKAGDKQFQDWFNKSESIDQSILRGFWDFSIHILTSTIYAAINKPESQTALEIGYGGGRLLNAAAAYFGNVIGIDIHDERTAVSDFLTAQGKTNFQLLRTNGAEIDVPSNSIDFIYSFIVLQHLPNFTTFATYMAETARCLKTGGIAQLYFGNLTLLKQFQRWPQAKHGYLEILDVPVNHISLLIRPAKVKSICRSVGLQMKGSGRSYKNAPDGFPERIGDQKFITVMKR